MQKKASPLEVKMEILNKKDWKDTNQLAVKVTGLFRNSGWKIKQHSHKILGDIIQIDMKAEHSGGIALMVLTPFDFTEKIPVWDTKIRYRIQLIIDGEELVTQPL